MIYVRDIMTASVAFCTPDTTLHEAARLMTDYDCGMLPVTEHERSRDLIGAITDRDIAVRGVGGTRNPLLLQVHDCMSRPIFTIGKDVRIEECIESMESHGVRRLPVVDEEGRCVGIVAQADIARRCDEATVAQLMNLISRRRAGLHFARGA